MDGKRAYIRIKAGRTSLERNLTRLGIFSYILLLFDVDDETFTLRTYEVNSA